MPAVTFRFQLYKYLLSLKVKLVTSPLNLTSTASAEVERNSIGFLSYGEINSKACAKSESGDSLKLTRPSEQMTLRSISPFLILIALKFTLSMRKYLLFSYLVRRLFTNKYYPLNFSFIAIGMSGYLSTSMRFLKTVSFPCISSK